MPRVQSFKFGSIVIGDKKYGRDVFMLADGTVKQRNGGFWKFGSHVIKKAEIEEMVAVNPEAIVVGTGTSAKAKLAADAELFAREIKIELTALPSREAITRLNQLANEGKRISALIHITC